MFFYPTASATAYSQRPKFVRAKHSATAEGENYAYGPTLQNLDIMMEHMGLPCLYSVLTFKYMKQNLAIKSHSTIVSIEVHVLDCTQVFFIFQKFH